MRSNLAGDASAPAGPLMRHCLPDRCIRILPHDNDSGAFFVALLRKTRHITFAPPLDPEAESEAAAVTAPHHTVTAADAAPAGDAQEVQAEGGGSELPKQFVDHCTRLSRMEARVQKVEPYVPLQRMPGGYEVWQSVADFYGISASFPSTQLLAHNERLKTIHYVTAAARRALDASQPSALSGARMPGDGEKGGADGEGAAGRNVQDMLNVVVAVSSRVRISRRLRLQGDGCMHLSQADRRE